MTRSLWFDQDSLTHCCGVNEVGGFSFDTYGGVVGATLDKSGTGYLIATFNHRQQAEYEAFSKMVKVLYQSPPKRNRGGNRVFVVVAQYKKPRSKKEKKNYGNLPIL